MDSVAGSALLPCTEDRPGQHGSCSSRYEIYGLKVCSDIPLPLRSSGRWDERSAEPDVVFRRAADGSEAPAPTGQLVARAICSTHGEEVVARRGPAGAWIWNRQAGVCHVGPDAREVVVYPLPGADERAVGLVLAGQVSVFVLNQRGYPTLHASAVVSEVGAVAFLGQAGQGKSTMAAGFVRRGMPLLTDDVLPLLVGDGDIRAVPSVPYMKLWPETVEGTLYLQESLPNLHAELQKKLLRLEDRYAFASQAVPLRVLYWLQRYDPVGAGTRAITIRPVSAREALAGMLGQVSLGAFLLPRETAALLPILARLSRQAPMRLLSYPDGFANQDAVCQRIVADVEALGRP